MNFRLVEKVALRQHGLITARQLNLVCSPDQRQRLVRNGFLRTSRRGVYALAGSSQSWEQDVEAVRLILPAEVYFASSTAARIWGLPADDGGYTSVTARRHVALKGVACSSCNALSDGDVTEHGKYPLTTVEKTLFDMCGWSEVDSAVRCAEDAIRRGLTSLTKLVDFHDRHRKRGRNGSVGLADLLDRLDAGSGPYQTRLERRVLAWIREAGLPLPRPQYPLVTSGKRYRLDFAYPESRVAIEADSFRWHSSMDRLSQDTTRQLNITVAGWHVVRVSWHSDPDTFIKALSRALQQRSA